jgi:putative acetyltransferase
LSEVEFDIRYTRILDISYLRKWIQDPTVLRWFSMASSEEIEQALAVWMSFARYNASLTAVMDRQPCGIATLFLPFYKKTLHHCLFKICVAPECRGKGIGSALIKNIKHLAKNQFNMEAIYAEVFEGNPLIPLLEKFDFHPFVKQDYYVKTDTGYLSRILLETLLKEGPNS